MPPVQMAQPMQQMAGQPVMPMAPVAGVLIQPGTGQATSM